MCVDGLREVLQLVRGGWLEKVPREVYDAAPTGRRAIVHQDGQRHYAIFHLGEPEQVSAEEEAFARMKRGDPPPGDLR